MRDWHDNRVPARGGGPRKTNSCSACKPRWLSISTCDHGLAVSQKKPAVVRNVGSTTGWSLDTYAGFAERVARANSMILPRSTSISNGALVAPMADLLAICLWML